jgi:pyruvate/2-oxoglutarate dehydrogenase complex dihydrolipoamide acyltransferase (E2) component
MDSRKKIDTGPKDCDIAPFPIGRLLISDAGRLAGRKHIIRCLIEADISLLRRAIQQNEAKTGELLSVTAYLIACLGRAIEANRRVQAYRDLWGSMLIFHDVDVMTYIEVEMDGLDVPLGHVIRAANRKSWVEISGEIRGIQNAPESAPNVDKWRFLRWFLFVPGPIRDTVFRIINRCPRLWRKYSGTVSLTAVGMFGKGGGWGIGYISHTLGVTVGGISERPVVRDGQVVIRECVDLTLEFDHDIVDGAPAARFVNVFKDLIETGSMLNEDSLKAES